MVAGLRVHQWLGAWDLGLFPEEEFQRKPAPAFLLMSMPAKVLKVLSDVNRRETDPLRPASQQLGVQRAHDVDRSAEIRRYVEGGYPLSVMPPNIDPADRTSLRKPGWLATAIIVNLPAPGARPNGRHLHEEDSMQVPTGWADRAASEIGLPVSFGGDFAWEPKDGYPIEVIDGQHRLWAFSDLDLPDDYELPVIAFVDLDVSWQAYLFWTINIKPKRISPSLAFDLYPLLREQGWLERGEGLHVYRETRAQELTEALWSQPRSPWYGRINMLGERGVRSEMPVNQASFVRSLEASLVRHWKARGASIGGLFGGSADGTGLPWTRAQQIAFLVHAWAVLRDEVAASQHHWAISLRDGLLPSEIVSDDPAFFGSSSLLASDQGVRGFMQTLNDVFYCGASELGLSDWTLLPADSPEDSVGLIDALIDELKANQVGASLTELARALSSFDWRSSKASSLSPTEQLVKLAYRGSSGYGTIRLHLLEHLASGDSRVASFAKAALALRKRN